MVYAKCRTSCFSWRCGSRSRDSGFQLSGGGNFGPVGSNFSLCLPLLCPPFPAYITHVTILWMPLFSKNSALLFGKTSVVFVRDRGWQRGKRAVSFHGANPADETIQREICTAQKTTTLTDYSHFRIPLVFPARPKSRFAPKHCGNSGALVQTGHARMRSYAPLTVSVVTMTRGCRFAPSSLIDCLLPRH